MIKKGECRSHNLIIYHNPKPNKELVEQVEQDLENAIACTQKLISSFFLNLRFQIF